MPASGQIDSAGDFAFQLFKKPLTFKFLHKYGDNGKAAQKELSLTVTNVVGYDGDDGKVLLVKNYNVDGAADKSIYQVELLGAKGKIGEVKGKDVLGYYVKTVSLSLLDADKNRINKVTAECAAPKLASDIQLARRTAQSKIQDKNKEFNKVCEGQNPSTPLQVKWQFGTRFVAQLNGLKYNGASLSDTNPRAVFELYSSLDPSKPIEVTEIPIDENRYNDKFAFHEFKVSKVANYYVKVRLQNSFGSSYEQESPSAEVVIDDALGCKIKSDGLINLSSK